MTNSEKGNKELLARIEDLISSAEEGILSMTGFLSPAEAFYAKEIIRSFGISDRSLLFGGYADAERKRLIILPSYLDGAQTSPDKMLFEYFSEEADLAVRVIRISGSGYRVLTHRDYLGGILGLGVERDAVGDIIILDDRSAYAFTSDSVAKLLLDSLERVGSDKVELERITLDRNFSFKREFKEINDTVASARLDCVVASLANLSRDKAQRLVDGGACSLNYAEETRCDRAVKAGDIITLRGYGKFIIRELNEKTKKGRLRLCADKYV